MHVHEIGGDAFEKYAFDLLHRLDRADADRPTIWVSVGASGKHVAQAILKIKTDHAWLPTIKVVPVAYNPELKAYRFEDPEDGSLMTNASILMIDSIVNSGSTMLAALDFLRSVSPPAHVLSYATAVRVTASFVPNIFSVPIGPNDRVFLPWHKARPNNRMTMRGVFRDLSEQDLTADPILSDQEFMNRVLWKDRWYTMKAEPTRRVIVCDIAGKIASFVNFTIDPNEGELHVDEVATDKKHQGQGLAGALLRFAETLARATRCRRMSLWSHEAVIEMYEKMSYVRTGQSIQCGSDGTFVAMDRPLGSSKLALATWRRAE